MSTESLGSTKSGTPSGGTSKQKTAAGKPSNRGSLEPWLKDEVDFYPHQVEGVKWLKDKRGALLADDMGLGKTLQMLAVFGMHIWKVNKLRPGESTALLVVVPVSLRDNWEDEIQKFTRIPMMKLEGSPAQRVDQLEKFREWEWNKILVINYEQVAPHLDQLNNMNFKMLIADEAHTIKNPKAKRTKAFLDLRVPRRFMLTGTPILKHVDDLWTLLECISPGQWGSYWSFTHKYCNTPDAPIWMANGTFKPIGEIKAGDKVMGWEENQVGRRTLCESVVEEVRIRTAPMVIESTLDDGKKIKCTPDHQWLSGNHNDSHEWTSISDYSEYTQRGLKRTRFATLSRVVDPIEDNLPHEEAREAFWLGGVYDGEASRYLIAQDPRHNPDVYARIQEALDMMDIPYTAQANGISVRGGRQSYVKLINWCGITRNTWLKNQLQTQLNRRKTKVVSVKELGAGEVVSMQTTTGNYVAWGLASKNCVYGGYKNKQIVGIKNEQQLINKLNDVMLRRTKEEVLDLPDVQYVTRKVSLSDRQKKIYNHIVDKLELDRENGMPPEKIEYDIVKEIRLRQVCATTATVLSSGEDTSTKLDLAIEDATEILDNGNKLVVFSQFKPAVAAYVERIKKASPNTPVYVMTGDVDKSKRQDLVKKWSSEPGAAVIVGIIKVMGTGLNMTAARHAQFIDKEYAPGLNKQAVDRLNRIGASTTQSIQVFEYFVRNSAEARVERIIKSKIATTDLIVDNNNAAFAAAVREAVNVRMD